MVYQYFLKVQLPGISVAMCPGPTHDLILMSAEKHDLDVGANHITSNLGAIHTSSLVPYYVYSDFDSDTIIIYYACIHAICFDCEHF